MPAPAHTVIQKWWFLSSSKVRTIWRLSYFWPRSDLFWRQVKLIKRGAVKPVLQPCLSAAPTTCEYSGMFHCQISAVLQPMCCCCWCWWTHLTNQHSLINSACDCVQEQIHILFWAGLWVWDHSSPVCAAAAAASTAATVPNLQLCRAASHCCEHREGLDTSALHMATINPLSDRWLNLWVMILFLFTCKCLHFNEMEIPHLLYSKLMNGVSVIRSFFLQFKGQGDKRKENLLFILSLCCVTTRMVIFNKEIEIFMPEGLRFVEAVELW